MRPAWVLSLLLAAGCADLIGADFGERQLRPSGGAGGEAGAGAGGSAGGEGGAGGSGGAGLGGMCMGTCVDMPEDSSWQGPLAVYFGAPPGPTCESLHPGLGLALAAGIDPTTPSATCEACTCDANSLDCGNVVIEIFHGNGCAAVNECAMDADIGEDTCTIVSCETNVITNVRYGGQPTPASSCAPVPVTPQVLTESPTFSTVALGCDVNGAPPTCPNATDVCLPYSGSDAGVKAPCVFNNAVQPCPAGFPDPLDVFSVIDDGRSCNACECDNPSCTVESIRLGNQLCVPASESVSMGGVGSCLAATDADAINGLRWLADKECTPSVSTVTGQVTATTPVTICCAP